MGDFFCSNAFSFSCRAEKNDPNSMPAASRVAQDHGAAEEGASLFGREAFSIFCLSYLIHQAFLPFKPPRPTDSLWDE